MLIEKCQLFIAIIVTLDWVHHTQNFHQLLETFQPNWAKNFTNSILVLPLRFASSAPILKMTLVGSVDHRG